MNTLHTNTYPHLLPKREPKRLVEIAQLAALLVKEQERRQQSGQTQRVGNATR